MTVGELSILVTGCGSLGAALAHHFAQTPPARLVILSRDFHKHNVLRSDLGNPDWLRTLVGDVRDLARLKRAMHGVDVVIHTAAIKDIVSCEYNPREAVLTNVIGSQNIVDAAIATGVRKVALVGTDKNCNPTSCYGYTKALAERLFIQSNVYSDTTRFSVVRWGNVLGSAGSVVPLWRQQMLRGEITLTDERMTRFWITMDQAVEFLLTCIFTSAYGGEIFIPKLPACKLTDLAAVIAPNAHIRVMGLRPGEKLSEVLVTEEESRHALDCGDSFVVLPEFREWASNIAFDGVPAAVGAYSSATAPQLTCEELAEMLADGYAHINEKYRHECGKWVWSGEECPICTS